VAATAASGIDAEVVTTATATPLALHFQRQQGNNFVYAFRLNDLRNSLSGVMAAYGSYRYSFRFSVGGGSTWKPCFTTAQCDPRLPGPRLVCSGGVCTEGPGVGAPCTEFVCGAGYCDTAALPPTCVAAPGLGDGCAGGGLCGDGLRCQGGACVAPLSNGATCDSPAECESYRCIAGSCLAPGASPCSAVPPT